MAKIYNAMNLFGNVVINKIPSRHIRRAFYRMMGAKIGEGTFLFRRAETLHPKGLKIGKNSTVGWFTLLDCRGGVQIGDNVNISSYVKIISAGHDVQSPTFEGTLGKITIHKDAWIATGAMILEGVTIGEGAVVAAGAVVTKDVAPFTVVGGVPAKEIGKRCKDLHYLVQTPLLH